MLLTALLLVLKVDRWNSALHESLAQQVVGWSLCDRLCLRPSLLGIWHIAKAPSSKNQPWT